MEGANFGMWMEMCSKVNGKTIKLTDKALICMLMEPNMKVIKEFK